MKSLKRVVFAAVLIGTTALGGIPAQAATRIIDPLTAALTPATLCSNSVTPADSLDNTVSGGLFTRRDTSVQGYSQTRFVPGTGWVQVPISQVCASVGSGAVTFAGTKVGETIPVPGQRNYWGDIVYRNAGGGLVDLTGLESISVDYSVTGLGFALDILVYDTANEYQRYFTTAPSLLAGSGTVTVNAGDFDPQTGAGNPATIDWSRIKYLEVSVSRNSGDNGTVTLTNLRIDDDDPTITAFAPPARPVGEPVVITGTKFTGATTVTFNGTPATSFTVDSANQITAVVPAGATSGPISVTTPLGSATSATSFTVLVPSPTLPKLRVQALTQPPRIKNPGVLTGGVPQTQIVSYQITRTGPAGSLNRTSTVQWQTLPSVKNPARACAAVPADNSAAPACNFVTVAPATLTFLPGETTKTVTVTVVGAPSEQVPVPGLNYTVTLSSPDRATIAKGVHTMRITRN